MNDHVVANSFACLAEQINLLLRELNSFACLAEQINLLLRELPELSRRYCSSYRTFLT